MGINKPNRTQLNYIFVAFKFHRVPHKEKFCAQNYQISVAKLKMLLTPTIKYYNQLL